MSGCETAHLLRHIVVLDDERIVQNRRANENGQERDKATEALREAHAEIAKWKAKFDECDRDRALAEKDAERERLRLAACGVAALGYFKGCIAEYKSASLGDVLRLRAQSDKMRKERDAYQKAKQENDDRFMIERDEARAEVDRLRASNKLISKDGSATAKLYQKMGERVEKLEALLRDIERDVRQRAMPDLRKIRKALGLKP
jgi:hypothetical protein